MYMPVGSVVTGSGCGAVQSIDSHIVDRVIVDSDTAVGPENPRVVGGQRVTENVHFIGCANSGQSHDVLPHIGVVGGKTAIRAVGDEALVAGNRGERRWDQSGIFPTH